MENAEVTKDCETCAHSCRNCPHYLTNDDACRRENCPHHICFSCGACECWAPFLGVEKSNGV